MRKASISSWFNSLLIAAHIGGMSYFWGTDLFKGHILRCILIGFAALLLTAVMIRTFIIYRVIIEAASSVALTCLIMYGIFDNITGVKRTVIIVFGSIIFFILQAFVLGKGDIKISDTRWKTNHGN